MNMLPFRKKVAVISALSEGCSIRATERLTGVHRDTILHHSVAVGEACRRLHNAVMRELQVGVLELDELWAFVGKKNKRLTDKDPPEFGDQYTYIALAATQKAIVSFATGKRDSTTTNDFVTDLRGRILGRPQITTDGFQPYAFAVGAAFGQSVDYAQIIKEYGLADPADERRYSPPKCTGVRRQVMGGKPDFDKISTSYVERQNLTCRVQSKRFARLTNCFSKKLRNHQAAVALYVCWYNFVKVHETLKTSPAVALDVTDHVWSMAELIDAALSIAPEDAPRLPPAATPPVVVDVVSVDDVDPRQMLLDFAPKALPPPRPTVDMEQVEMFPSFQSAPAA